MHDRSSLLSGAGVGVSIVGMSVGNQLISLLGPLLALAVHCWTESRKGGYIQRIDSLERRIEDLQERLDRAAHRPSEDDLAWLRAGERLPAPTGPEASSLIARVNGR